MSVKAASLCSRWRIGEMKLWDGKTCRGVQAARL